MLRIPLPEYDGFALREACKGQHVFRFSTMEHNLARCEKWAHIHFFASVRFARAKAASFVP